MRPDEQIALKWPQVDLVQKKLSIRESRVQGFEGPPKTEASEREIDMLPMVEQALLAQREVSVHQSTYVFCSKVNGPLDICNLRERVWKPTLKAAGLRMRHFYNTRHTFASLMLGSGENIGWVARMMGHKDIQMVLKRYHKFIPNLTWRDGSAFLEKASQWGLVNGS